MIGWPGGEFVEGTAIFVLNGGVKAGDDGLVLSQSQIPDIGHG